MQLMYEHLSILSDLNKRHDNFFDDANQLRENMIKFQVYIYLFIFILLRICFIVLMVLIKYNLFKRKIPMECVY